MTVQIVGADYGAEREAAETLKEILEPLVGAHGQLLIVVGARCLGEDIQDIDLLLMGSFGKGLAFTGKFGDARQQTIRLVNLALVIEVKDHPSERVCFDSQHIRVLYKKGWHDATDQVRKQILALRHFLYRHDQPQPWFEGLIWLRNYIADKPITNTNVLTGTPSADDFLEAIERIRSPKAGEQDYYIAFTKNQDIKVIQQAAAFFRQTILPTELDRRRLELICKRLIGTQKYADRFGHQLLVFRGRGGSGKTIHLLRLAKDLYDRGQSILLLTFNKALVADIRRLLVILNINNQGFDQGIHISTAHSFFIRMLIAWDLWQAGSEHGDFPEARYSHCKADLLELLSNETPDTLSAETVACNTPEVFGWDYIVVDEAQDWPEDERDLLYRCFGPERCVIADGVDQLIRQDKPCDWTGHPLVRRNRQTVALRRALRMKSNLCRFIRAFVEELGNEWDQEVNDEIAGGEVTIICGTYTHNLHEELFKRHQEHGNEPVDALFCVPPNTMTTSPPLPDRLRNWGYDVWDGTSNEVRDSFPTTHKEHRVVKYESCRGLEGWTVVCLSLDKFYEHRLRIASAEGTPGLFDPDETFAHRQAAAWIVIPLTRAIDHLVLQLEGQGVVTETCHRLTERFSDFVTWRTQ
jgi:hypothetical protein